MRHLDMNLNLKHKITEMIKQQVFYSPTVRSRGSIPPGKLMGPQPLPWGSSSTMKMLFLQSLQRPKWAASQVALSFSTRGLSTAQWSVTTAASIDDMPTTITTDVILTLVACSSNMLPLGVCVCVCRVVGMCVRVPVFARVYASWCVWHEWLCVDRVCVIRQSRLPLSCLSSAPWRRTLTPEVPPSCLRLHYTSDVLSSLPALLSTALSFSFSALCLVVGKKGPDNSALVSTSLLSSSPSLVAFGGLRPFSYKMKMYWEVLAPITPISWPFWRRQESGQHHKLSFKL